MKNKTAIPLGLALVVSMSALTTGCIPPTPKPEELVLPTEGVLQDNSGKYMSPYTQDDVMAKWTDKAVNVALAGNVGKAIGAQIGQEVFKQIPIFGGLIGSKLGEAAAKKIAIDAAGGWEYIKSTSDISFDSYDTMAVYLYVKYSKTEHYQNAMKATYGIYPELQQKTYSAIGKAEKKSAPAEKTM